MEYLFNHLLKLVKSCDVTAQEKNAKQKQWLLSKQYLQPLLSVEGIQEEPSKGELRCKKKLLSVYHAAKHGMQEGVLTGFFLGGCWGIYKFLNENLTSLLVGPSEKTEEDKREQINPIRPIEKRNQTNNRKESVFERNQIKGKGNEVDANYLMKIDLVNKGMEARTGYKPRESREPIWRTSGTESGKYTRTGFPKAREKIEIVNFAFIHTTESAGSGSIRSDESGSPQKSESQIESPTPKKPEKSSKSKTHLGKSTGKLSKTKSSLRSADVEQSTSVIIETVDLSTSRVVASDKSKSTTAFKKSKSGPSGMKSKTAQKSPKGDPSTLSKVVIKEKSEKIPSQFSFDSSEKQSESTIPKSLHILEESKSEAEYLRMPQSATVSSISHAKSSESTKPSSHSPSKVIGSTATVNTEPSDDVLGPIVNLKKTKSGTKKVKLISSESDNKELKPSTKKTMSRTYISKGNKSKPLLDPKYFTENILPSSKNTANLVDADKVSNGFLSPECSSREESRMKVTLELPKPAKISPRASILHKLESNTSEGEKSACSEPSIGELQGMYEPPVLMDQSMPSVDEIPTEVFSESTSKEESEKSLRSSKAEESEKSLISGEMEESEESLRSSKAEESENSLISREMEELKKSLRSSKVEESEKALISREMEELKKSLRSSKAEESEEFLRSSKAEESEKALISREMEDSVKSLRGSKTEELKKSFMRRETEESQKSLWSRKIEESQRSSWDRKIEESRKSLWDRKTLEPQKPLWDKKIEESRKSLWDRKTEESQKSSGEKKTEDSRKSSEERKTKELQKSFGEMIMEEPQKSSKDWQIEESQKFFGERKAEEPRKSIGERKREELRKSFEERKTEELRKSFGEVIMEEPQKFLKDWQIEESQKSLRSWKLEELEKSPEERSSPEVLTKGIGSATLRKFSSPQKYSGRASAQEEIEHATTAFIQKVVPSSFDSGRISMAKPGVGSSVQVKGHVGTKDKKFPDGEGAGFSLLSAVNDNIIVFSACNCAIVLGVVCGVISTTRASLRI